MVSFCVFGPPTRPGWSVSPYGVVVGPPSFITDARMENTGSLPPLLSHHARILRAGLNLWWTRPLG